MNTSPRIINILILEDNPHDVEILLSELTNAGIDPTYSVVWTKEEYLNRLDESVDIILSDYSMPQFDAPHALALLQERALDIPFIVVSGTVGEDAAVAIMRAGATDYLLKDRLSRLGIAIDNALNQKNLRRQNALSADLLKKMIRAVEQSADNIMITDRNGVIEYVNPTFLQTTGYTSSEVLGKLPSLLKSGEHSASFYSQLWGTITTGKVFRAEFINKKKNGEIYYEVQTISPVVDDHGAIINFVSAGKDITERKKAEEATQISERRHKLLIEAMNEGVLQVDNDDVILFVNDQYCAMVGYSRHELLGNVAHELLLLEEDRDFIRTKNRTRVAGIADAYEIRMRKKSGEIRWFQISGAPVFDSAGTVIGSIGIHTDITEQKKTVESLKLFRALIDGSNDAIEVIDPVTGRFLDMNERECIDLGYSREEMLTLSIFDVDPNVRRETFQEETAAERKVGNSIFESVHKRKDGSVYPVEVTVNFMQLDKEYIVAIVRDITERKQTERRNELISNLGYRLSSVETSGQAAKIVVEVADQLFGWDACTVDLYSSEQDRLNPILVMDIVGDERRAISPASPGAIPTPTIRKALTEGTVLVLRDRTDGSFPPTKRFGDTSRLSASLLFVPIRYGGKAIGVISIQSYTHNKYDQHDAVILQGMADQCGAAFIRIQTVEALKKSESSLRRAQQIGKIGNWYVDIEKETLEWSDEVFRIFGRDPKTFAPTNSVFFDLVHPDDRESVKAAFAESILTGRRYEIEHRITLPDGSIKEVSEQAEIVKNDNGKSIAMLGIVQDITERKNVERRDELLARLGYQLSSAETSEQAAEIVTTTADQLFGWDACTVDIYSGETDSVRTVWNVDIIGGKRKVIPPFFLHVPPTERMKKIFTQGALLILREHGQGFGTDATAFGDTSRPSASLMFVPIRHAEQNIGILSIQSYAFHKYSQKDLITLQGMADQCGAAFMRIRTVEALRKSEANLRRAQHVGKTGSWFADLNRNTLEWSEEVFNIFGKEPKEYTPTNDSFFASVHPDDREAVLAASAESIRTGKRYEVEHRIILPDGSIKTVAEQAEIVCDGNGKSIEMYGVVQDISDRKKAEKALKSSEAKYRDIFTFAPVGIYQSTRDGRFITVNKTLVSMLGYSSEEELLQKNLTTDVYFDPEERNRLIQHFEPKGSGTEIEIRWKKKEGTPVWVQLTSHAIKNSQGNTLFFEGFVYDITERKQIEDALKQSEERYRNLIDSAVDAIFTVSKDGLFTSLNPAFETITGWKSNQWIGKSFTDLVHSDDRKTIAENFELRLAGTEVPVHEYRMITASGSIVVVEILTAPQYVDNVLIGIFGVARNVTERKQLEIQFRQAQKMESIGTLAGGIAHDFNNILGIILASATLLGRIDRSDKNFASTLEMINRTVQRGAMLVRQILTFARKNEMQVTSVQINDIILELSKMLEMTIPRTIEIELHLDATLPNINADSNQVHQALLNLCVNARDAILDRKSDGVRSGKISITTARVERKILNVRFQNLTAEQYLVVRIADTGIGMNEETKHRIFDPFFTTKEIGKGTGLGLAVVYGVMESLQGFVDVESTPGQGTTFALYFPVSETTQTNHLPPPESIDDSHGGSETILVVEDEESLMELVKLMLETKGYAVVTAATGVEGVETFQRYKENISLVFTDFGLPGMDGFTMLHRIKEMKPDTRMLLASGYLESSQRSEIFQLGVYDIIQKPYEPSLILSKVREILDRKNNT